MATKNLNLPFPRNSWQTLICLLFVIFIISHVYAQETKELNVENENYSLEVLENKEAECCPGKRDLYLKIYNKKTNKFNDISFRERYKNIDKIRLYKNKKLIIEGSLKRGGNIFSLAELKEYQKEQNNNYDYLTFWLGIEYAYSPSGRFFIYETRFGPMDPPQYKRSIILIIDMEKNLFENSLFADGKVHEEKFGLPVFPEINVHKKSYDVSLGEYNFNTSPFLWSEDENKIIFFNHTGKENYIVSIDISNGIENPKILKRFINIDGILTKARITEQDT